MIKILKSSEDASVNFVIHANDGGFFEARFVQRKPDYFIVYLSSHTGCNQTCRFCHLTATGQTTMTPASIEDFKTQAKLVLDYYTDNVVQSATTVHFNFMARGEPLLNDTVVLYHKILFNTLANLAEPMGLSVKFKISTIMPVGFDGNKLVQIFDDERVMLYYSLYSADPAFRKKWLPNAMDVDVALTYINIFQEITERDIAVHGAFIEGQNDSIEHAHTLTSTLNSYRIKYKLNIVRYNPHDQRYGVESPEQRIQDIFNIITVNKIPTASTSKIVPRVGFDVKASCGMFV